MKKEIIRTEMKVKDNIVGVMRVENVDYISLMDLAKYENPNLEGNMRDYANICLSYSINIF